MTGFWAETPVAEAPAPAYPAEMFWATPDPDDRAAPTGQELFDAQQERNVSASRHRNSLRHERPDERARRQQHRAEEIARQLGTTRSTVVKAMLQLVQADEAVNPKGEPPDPVAPGARAAMKPKPKKAEKSRAEKAEPGHFPVAKRNTAPAPAPAQPEQMGFWE